MSDDSTHHASRPPLPDGIDVFINVPMNHELSPLIGKSATILGHRLLGEDGRSDLIEGDQYEYDVEVHDWRPDNTPQHPRHTIHGMFLAGGG
ncbi:MAG TPA: hypothetical protein VMU98_08980 [Acidimicrobiales bacterium]|nr:hypothetical protein [Acidimicrobiales bacterium]